MKASPTIREQNPALNAERNRIEFLVERDGVEATQRWVLRAIDIYERALADPHSPNRNAFFDETEASIRAFRTWLSSTSDANGHRDEKHDE